MKVQLSMLAALGVFAGGWRRPSRRRRTDLEAFVQPDLASQADRTASAPPAST